MEGRHYYPPDTEIPGTIYKVKRVLGAGGMGTVYDVEDTTVGKSYVLKTLHPELGKRDDLAKRMDNEARTLARLRHTNIVNVITAGVTTDVWHLPYYVMEKLYGQNLRDVLAKKRTLELPIALHIAIDLLDALEHAHDAGVIHRDVKPENIFLSREHNGVTVTKLLDFGIVHLLDAEKGMTAGRFMGTLRYASPEQLLGETVTPRADLYAVGLVLYEMLAGQGPFDDEGDQHAIAKAHLSRDPPLLMTFEAVVPTPLEKIIRSALSKSIDRRPKDAWTFGAQLRNIKNALQLGARHAPLGRQVDSKVPTAVDVLAQGVPTRPPSSPSPFSSSGNMDPDPFSQVVSPPLIMSPPPVSPLRFSPPPPSPAALAPTEAAQTHPSTPAAKASPDKDTIVGMSPPSRMGGTLEDAPHVGVTLASGPTPVVTPLGGSTPSIDRRAPTHAASLEVPPAGIGPEGTEPIPLVVSHQPWAPNPATAKPGVDELLVALPTQEANPATSEAGSAHTIQPFLPELKRSAAVWIVAAGTFGLVLIGALIIAFRHHRSPADDARASAATAAQPSTVPLPVAAPTIPTPLFDEVPSASASAAAVQPAPPPTTPAATAAPPPRPRRPKPVSVDSAAKTDVTPLAPQTPAKRKLPGSGL